LDPYSLEISDDREIRTLTLKEQGFLRPLWLPLHHIVRYFFVYLFN
jgi:hypothetical protein